MIKFDEAVDLIGQVAVPLGVEAIDLEDADGRVLASPVVARLDSPRADVSAMDGYAVRDMDLIEFPARLKVAGESFAGHGWSGKLGAGECARIFTGAHLPGGADRVVIQEEVTRESDIAIVERPPGRALHIRLRGTDFMEGDKLLDAGRLLHPRAIVAAAAADLPQVDVYRRPRVRILSTGDELASPGTAAGSSDLIPESVSFGVAALARRWGADILGKMRLQDNLASMKRTAAESLADADVVVVTGGASVGEKDFGKAMFEGEGFGLVFSKVALKPGKPVWLGRTSNALVVGLPGNPTSALVTARLFLAPLLAGLSGREPEDSLRWRRMPLTASLLGCGDRETFHRARNKSGEAEIMSNQDSSAQRTLVEADLLARQPANSSARKRGEAIDVLDF